MKQKAITILLIVSGWICVVLGVIGIFLPLMPTTVFLLIATFCFARSSEKFYFWLINHKHLGVIITSWDKDKGMERSTRTKALSVLWFGICLSCWLMWDIKITMALILTATLISTYLLHLPSYEA